jgi:hypothetical protein
MTKLPSDVIGLDSASSTVRATSVDVDPELERQLALAEADATVEAVLVLRQRGAEIQPFADLVALLQRLGRNQSNGPVQHTALPRLGVLIVRAQARVIRRLLAEPVVAVASSNRSVGRAE